ncbi:MAG: GNAT family N-acetyltransferase [Dehalococcoidia bacterium]|nr:GNAT family N-acetyltransferase [Dehalococcoidia bacterium]
METGRLVVKRVESAAELEAALDLRTRVFVREQGVPIEEEADEHDASATHVIALTGGRVVGTGRAVFPTQLPPRPTDGEARDTGVQTTPGQVRIGRMAVEQAWRRCGVGSRVLEALEAEARRVGMEEAVLAAQTNATGFYASHGYREEGAVFPDAGIDHILMRKRL